MSRRGAPSCWRYIAAATSGSLLALAQTQAGCGWLIFLAWVPWCLVADPTRLLRVWSELALLVALSAVLSISWIGRAGPGYEYLLIAAVFYATAFALIPALCCRLGAHLGQQPAAGLLLLPAGVATMELAGRLGALQVWWPLTAQPLAEWPLLGQAAALAGPEFLALPVCATAVAVALSARPSHRLLRLAAWLQGPGLLLSLATLAALAVAATGEPRSLRLGVIQPNVPQTEKWSPDDQQRHLRSFDALIDGLLEARPDLIALPETAVAGYVRYEPLLADWVRNTVRRTARPLLFGSLDRDPGEARARNVAIMITPYNTVFTYAKRHLVPVAEVIPDFGPFDPLLRPLVVRLRGGTTGFVGGTQPTLFRLDSGVSFGTLICFEDIFPDLGRAIATTGADLMVVLINTERFGASSQALQQLRRAQLSAAAVGLPMVRVANSGVSASIDARGRLVEQIHRPDGKSVGFAGSAVFAVSLQQRLTPYRQVGDAAALGAIALLAALLLAGGRALRPRGG